MKYIGMSLLVVMLMIPITQATEKQTYHITKPARFTLKADRQWQHQDVASYTHHCLRRMPKEQQSFFKAFFGAMVLRLQQRQGGFVEVYIRRAGSYRHKRQEFVSFCVSEIKHYEHFKPAPSRYGVPCVASFKNIDADFHLVFWAQDPEQGRCWYERFDSLQGDYHYTIVFGAPKSARQACSGAFYTLAKSITYK